MKIKTPRRQKRKGNSVSNIVQIEHILWKCILCSILDNECVIGIRKVFIAPKNARRYKIIKMTLRCVSIVSKDCVESDKFSTIIVQKRNCKMSSKLMLRRENMKRPKKFRQAQSLKACQNPAKTTSILSTFLIILALSGRHLYDLNDIKFTIEHLAHIYI